MPFRTAPGRRAAALLLALVCAHAIQAQPAPQLSDDIRFLSYQRVPTWSAVLSDWNSVSPQVHLYDSDRYPGHAEFVSRGLNTGITFAQFRQLVRSPDQRSYLPFFLFDLRAFPVERDGVTYQWAVRIEDYGYTDSSEQMAEAVGKLNAAVVRFLDSTSGSSASVLFVLSENRAAQPSFGIEALLNARGIEGVSLPDLLATVGSPRVEILNPATAVGQLRYVDVGDTDTAVFESTDIVIFEELPGRVPPVSGIITLMPQTPLSHVNLLARNRGTLNLYALSLDDLPGAKDRLGELVRISAEQNRLTIAPVTEAQAEVHWATHRPPEIDIPEPLFGVTSIVDLHESGESVTTAAIGAKASNYAQLRNQFPAYVRPGHALPMSWYFEAASDPRFQQLQIDLLTGRQSMNATQVEALLSEMREALRSVSIAPEKQAALLALMENHYPDTRIRLRSSTNCEDLPEFNGAGLYESKGYNTYDDQSELFEDLLEVYASLWTPHAYAEREFYGIDQRRAGMAVLIHEAFPDEYANGVVLTIPGDDSFSILINSQPGESAVTNPEPGQVPESILFDDAATDDYLLRSASSIGPVFAPTAMRAPLFELKAVSIGIHDLLRRGLPEANRSTFGVDIEFKLVEEDGRISVFVKQGRLLGMALPN